MIVFEDPSMDILEIPYEATVMQGLVRTTLYNTIEQAQYEYQLL